MKVCIERMTDVVGSPDAQFAAVTEGGGDAAPGCDFHRTEELVREVADADGCV